MAEDKQAEPKGRSTEGQTSFLYSPQQTAEKICFDGGTFCTKPPGLIATAPSRNSLSLKVLANRLAGCCPIISKKRTVKQNKQTKKPNNILLGNLAATLCIMWTVSSGRLCHYYWSILQNVGLEISLWATDALFFSQVFTKKKKKRWRLKHLRNSEAKNP